MRILLAINGTDFGGTETSLAQLADRLRDRGHHITVLSLKPPGRIGRRIQQRGLRVITMNMAERASLVEMFSAARRLAQQLRKLKPDVVHSFLPRANVLTRLANRLSSRGCPHLSNEESVDLRRSRTVRLMDRLSRPWTNRTVAVSMAIRDVLVQRDGLRADRVEVIQNSIDLDAIDAVIPGSLRDELNLSNEELIFCSVGRLVEVKGYRHLIRAFSALRRSDSRAHLVIVGEGPEQGTLENVVRDADVADRVHLLGYRDDVVSILKATDVFVLSSLQEGLPLTLLEAMACGLPVIATTVGGIPAAVDDRVTGILVPPHRRWTADGTGSPRAPRKSSRPSDPGLTGDSGRLTPAMEELIDDAELRERLGANGRSRVQRIYSLDEAVSRFEGIYQELAAQTADVRGTETQ